MIRQKWIHLNKFILFLVLFSSFQQASINNRIYWSKNRTLSWKDYEGEIDTKSKYAVITDTQISYDLNVRDDCDSVELKIESFFNKAESWVKKGEENDYILKHELGHFDINEIYARKFRQKLSKQVFHLQNIKVVCRDIWTEIFRALTKEQDLYDSETIHSQDHEKQLKWDKKIADELKTLDQFANSRQTVPYFN